MTEHKIMIGDCIEQMRASVPDESVHCCVTSPPYWGLRDYGVEGQFGLEKTPGEYVARMVEVFREVKRVLRKDGTLWLNLGDSYANKALAGIPWRVAFALQADGWYLRSDIIWHKPNPMPESVTDRPTRSHEYIFLLTKSARYAYDADAIKEPTVSWKRMTVRGPTWVSHRLAHSPRPISSADEAWLAAATGLNAPSSAPSSDRKNARSVWTITPKSYKGAHFATFPEALPERCILAGCPVGGVVLDPFTGSGTTGAVAKRLGRDFIGCELNPQYAELAEQRISKSIAVTSRAIPPVLDPVCLQ